NPNSLAISSFSSLDMIPRLRPKRKQLLSVKSCYDTLSICRSVALTPVKKRNEKSSKPLFTAQLWLSHQHTQNLFLLPLLIHQHSCMTHVQKRFPLGLTRQRKQQDKSQIKYQILQ